jgi:hypothetical protein
VFDIDQEIEIERIQNLHRNMKFGGAVNLGTNE